MWGGGCLATLIQSPYDTCVITYCFYAGFLAQVLCRMDLLRGHSRAVQERQVMPA